MGVLLTLGHDKNWDIESVEEGGGVNWSARMHFSAGDCNRINIGPRHAVNIIDEVLIESNIIHDW